MTKFAIRLKALRKGAGLTQAQLAETLHVSTGTVAMWETDKRRPSIELYADIASLFHKRIDYVLGYSIDDRDYDYEMEYLM